MARSLIILLIFLTSHFQDQESVVVKACVSDTNGLPLKGVLVIYQRYGVYTNEDGKGAFKIPKKAVADSIRIRTGYVGYHQSDTLVKVNNTDTVRVNFELHKVRK